MACCARGVRRTSGGRAIVRSGANRQPASGVGVGNRDGRAGPVRCSTGIFPRRMAVKAYLDAALGALRLRGGPAASPRGPTGRCAHGASLRSLTGRAVPVRPAAEPLGRPMSDARERSERAAPRRAFHARRTVSDVAQSARSAPQLEGPCPSARRGSPSALALPRHRVVAAAIGASSMRCRTGMDRGAFRDSHRARFGPPDAGRAMEAGIDFSAKRCSRWPSCCSDSPRLPSSCALVLSSRRASSSRCCSRRRRYCRRLAAPPPARASRRRRQRNLRQSAIAAVAPVSRRARRRRVEHRVHGGLGVGSCSPFVLIGLPVDGLPVRRRRGTHVYAGPGARRHASGEPLAGRSERWSVDARADARTDRAGHLRRHAPSRRASALRATVGRLVPWFIMDFCARRRPRHGLVPAAVVARAPSLVAMTSWRGGAGTRSSPGAGRVERQ